MQIDKVMLLLFGLYDKCVLLSTQMKPLKIHSVITHTNFLNDVLIGGNTYAHPGVYVCLSRFLTNMNLNFAC